MRRVSRAASKSHAASAGQGRPRRASRASKCSAVQVRPARYARAARSRVKVKAPSSGLHVGNAAAIATHSCCCGGNNAELVACPAPASAAPAAPVRGAGAGTPATPGTPGGCPGAGTARGGCSSAGPGPGPAPGRRLVKGLKGKGPRGPGLWLLSRANCPCADSAKCPSESCFMFMFRNRRNTLAKRLWNARVLQREHGAAAGAAGAVGTAGAGPNPAAPGPPSQQAALRNTFLKRLKDPQLETLLQAVESRGASLTSCVVLDRDPDQQHQPHLLCCQIWRWPELQQGSELRPLPMCSVASGGSGVGNSVCCNPYHWSRLCKPESPPPPYGRPPEKRLKPEDCPPCEGGPAVAPRPPAPPEEDPLAADEPDDRKRDAAWGRTPPRWQDWQSWQGSLTTDGASGTATGMAPGMRPWCQLAYWELADRVGRLYPVQGPFINVSSAAEPQPLPRSRDRPAYEGLCLATLANQAPSRQAGTPPATAVERARAKIGLGVTLSQEADGVWAYNRSDHPIFVNSPTLDDPESRTLLVYRVPPGHCLNVFRADTTTQHWERWRRCNEAAHTGPVDPRAVRISFAKGWGPKYSRQEVTACPCWIEVLLSPHPCHGPCQGPCR